MNLLQHIRGSSDLLGMVNLSMGMLTLCAAFEIQAQILIPVLRIIANEENRGVTEKSGYYINTILYLSYTFMNFLVPPIIARIGSKWSMLIGMSCYIIFMLSFLYIEAWILYALAALLGFGAAMLWTSVGVNLVRISEEKNLTRNSAFLWTSIQMSLIFGSIFLMIILNTSDLVSSYKLIYLFCAIIGVLGIVIVSLMKTPGVKSDQDSKVDSEKSSQSIWQAFDRTFQLLRTKEMVLLCVIFFYNGFQTVFFGAMYTASLAATKRLPHNEAAIAYAMLFIGCGEICGGIFFGFSGSRSDSKFGKRRIATFGAILLLVANVLSLINLPADAPLHDTYNIAFIEPSLSLALFGAFLLGLSDCCWQTQILTILGGMYKDEDSPPAFAIFRCFQAFSTSIGCLIAPQFELYWTLLATSTLSIFATIAFWLVHRIAKAKVIQSEISTNEKTKALP
ncbi:unnamed protein product, partial [Mesorhabditis belari]|uniref:UNC93-like protein MFSD11 n=1 Tax=Mesorhabditis belari TaxID=2138241 RepID=A0AAF3EGY7_9BILA